MEKLDLEKIKKAIDLRFNKKLKELKYCYCIQGRVTKRNMDGTYNVKINENDENESIVKEKLGVYYPPNTLVEILVKNNSGGNEKYILWKI